MVSRMVFRWEIPRAVRHLGMQSHFRSKLVRRRVNDTQGARLAVQWECRIRKEALNFRLAASQLVVKLEAWQQGEAAGRFRRALPLQPRFEGPSCRHLLPLQPQVASADQLAA